MEIELERVENAVRIPIECLYTDNVGDYVFVSEDGIVRKKYFETMIICLCVRRRHLRSLNRHCKKYDTRRIMAYEG